jgi:hypothetical protein
VSRDAGRWRCQECGDICRWDEMLTAPNPFDADAGPIYGCRRCKCIDSFVGVCDEAGCSREASCGAPSDDGYRRTCWEHSPMRQRSDGA